VSLIKADALTASSGTNTNIAITGKGSGKVKLGDGNLLFPDADGSAGQYIKTDGSANLAWATPATDISGAFFQAVPSGNVSLPDSTYTKVTFNTEIYDPKGEYDHSTNHRYQPTAGTYLISAKITLVSATDGHRWLAVIYKNGSGQNYNYMINANASDENTMYISQIVTASGSDFYEIFAWQGSGSTRAVKGSGDTNHSYFQGHRIA